MEKIFALLNSNDTSHCSLSGYCSISSYCSLGAPARPLSCAHVTIHWGASLLTSGGSHGRWCRLRVPPSHLHFPLCSDPPPLVGVPCSGMHSKSRFHEGFLGALPMSRAEAFSSSSKLPGALPIMDEDHPQLVPAQPPRPRTQAASPHLQRSPSRGRSLTRKLVSGKQQGKGKLKEPLEGPIATSPAPHSVRPRAAHKVFEEMPPGRESHFPGKAGPSCSKPPVRKAANPAPVRSWANIARSTVKGYDLSFIPPMVVNDKVVVHISNVVLDAADPKWEECLVGYFIGKRLPFRMM